MVDAETAMEEGSQGVEDHGVVPYARMAVLGSLLAATGYALADLILGLGSTIMAPLRAFASGFATFISGTFLAPVRVTDAGATATVSSFLEGTGALLGPFAFPVAVVSAIAGMYVFLWFLRKVSISPMQLIRRD